jgi:hypothetical protein
VWLGDRHQGTFVQGIKWDRRAAPRHRAPSPGSLTGLMEPCGALPRKCLFMWFVRSSDPTNSFRDMKSGHESEDSADVRERPHTAAYLRSRLVQDARDSWYDEE